MPFDFDKNSGQWQWKGDDSDWLGSPTVAAPSALDDAMRRIKIGNVEDQAKAADNYVSNQQAGGLATATGAPSAPAAPFALNYGGVGSAGGYTGNAGLSGQTPEQYAAAHGIDVEGGRNSSSALVPLPLGAQQLQNVVRNVIPNVDATSNQGPTIGSRVAGNALNDVGAPQPLVRAAETAADVAPYVAIGGGGLASKVRNIALSGAGGEAYTQTGLPDVPYLGNPGVLGGPVAYEGAGAISNAIRGRGEPPVARMAPDYDVFRGSGRAEKGSVYNEFGSGEAIFKDATYYAFDPKVAAEYGPNVEASKVGIEKPLVLKNDEQYRALSRQAGMQYPNPFGMEPAAQAAEFQKLRDFVTAQGHDGIVVQMDQYGDNAKLLRNLFGDDQVIDFKPQQGSAPPAAAPPVAPAAGGAVFKPENVLNDPRATVANLRATITNMGAEPIAGGKEALRGQLGDLIQQQRTPAAEPPAPATSPAASSPPTGEAAAGQPAPAGAGTSLPASADAQLAQLGWVQGPDGVWRNPSFSPATAMGEPAPRTAGAQPPVPAAMINRGQIPFDSVKQPNLPGLVDAEKFGVAQAWAAKMPNIDPAIATDGQIRAGLYNAGFEPTVKGMNTPELAKQGIPDLRTLYYELDRQGIKLPQEEPPSGMPDTRDIAMSRAPQRQEAEAAAGGNGAGVPPETPPSGGFRDHMGERGRGYPLPRGASDISNVGKGETFTDDSGRAVTNQGGTGGGTGRPTFGGPGGRNGGNGGEDFGSPNRPTPNPPTTWRDPTAWEQAMAIIRAPVRVLLTGGHVLRTGIGTTIMHPTESVPLLVDYMKGWVSRDARQSMIDETRALPLVAGEGRIQARAPGGDQFLNIDPAKAGIRAADFRTAATEHVRPAGVDRVMNRFPVFRNLAEAGMNYISGLRDAVYNEEAIRALRAGDGVKPDGSIDVKYYKDMYDTLSHNTGHGFGNGTPGEAQALGVGPSAWLARFKSVADVFNKSGTVNPFGTGARSIAIRNMLGIAGFMAVTDLVGQAVGGRVYLPFNMGSVGATDVTNPYGVESKLFKVSTTSPTGFKTLYSGGSGYDSLFRIFANVAIDIRNDDRDALEKHLNAYLKGQMGPVPEIALELLLGPSGLNSQNPDVQAFAKDWKGEWTTVQSLKTEAAKNGFAERWAPVASQSIYAANEGWGPTGTLRAAPSLWGGEVQTLPPSQAFTDRMTKMGLTGPQMADVQDKTAPYFQFLDQNQKQGMTMQEMNQAQQAYLAGHPEVVAALRQGGYSVPTTSPFNLNRSAPGGNSPFNLNSQTGGTQSPFQLNRDPPTYKTPTPFQPRNKQPVPGAR